MLLGKNVLGKILVVKVYSMCIGLKYILKEQLAKGFGGEWAASTLFRKLLKKVFRIYSGILREYGNKNIVQKWQK